MSIFSALGGLFGLGDDMSSQADKAMADIQAMKLDPSLSQANQMAQSLANQGLDASTLNMAMQQHARNQSAAYRALSGRRSALAAAPGLFSSDADFATRLAAENAMAKRQNKQFAVQAGMQYGQAATDLEKSKKEAAFNQISAAQNRASQEQSGLLGTLGGIAGALIMSDYRVKNNITLVGKSPEGINIYTFEYNGQDGLYEGVMAQELLGTKFNDSVVMNDNGIYAVDYSKLDVEFKQIN